MATPEQKAIDLDLGPGDVSTPSTPGSATKRKRRGEPIPVADRKTGVVTGHLHPEKGWLFVPSKESK